MSDAHDIADCLWAYFGIQNPVHGLDYGCNDGAVQVELEARYPQLQMQGVDANPEAVSVARSMGRKVGLVMDGYRTKIKPGSLDFVICLATLAHIPKARLAVGEMCSLVRRGGLVIIETPHPAYDEVVSPMHWFSGYKGDPTIVRKVWPQELRNMVPGTFDELTVDNVGRRLPWPFSYLALTSDYRAMYRRRL